MQLFLFLYGTREPINTDNNNTNLNKLVRQLYVRYTLITKTCSETVTKKIHFLVHLSNRTSPEYCVPKYLS